MSFRDGAPSWVGDVVVQLADADMSREDEPLVVLGTNLPRSVRDQLR